MLPGGGGDSNHDLWAPFELHLENEAVGSRTPLYDAICAHDQHQVLHAIHTGADVNRRQGHTCYTYLHLLIMVCDVGCEDKCVPIVYQLSNAGADVNAEDSRGSTPLTLAISKHLTHIMAALIRCGVDLAERDYAAAIRDASVSGDIEAEMLSILDKYSPGMWSAVATGNTPVVSLLVNSWCRVNVRKGKVSLLALARHSRAPAELLTLLDEFQVPLEFVHATLAGDEKRMLEFLMDAKPVDPYIMDISHQASWDACLTPRSLRDAAWALGHTHVLHLLPEGDYDTVSTKIPAEEISAASCSDYSSGGSNPEPGAADYSYAFSVLSPRIVTSVHTKPTAASQTRQKSIDSSSKTPKQSKSKNNDSMLKSVIKNGTKSVTKNETWSGGKNGIKRGSYEPAVVASDNGGIYNGHGSMTSSSSKFGTMPRLTSFTPEPISGLSETHYVQGFFFHEPEPKVEDEQVFHPDRTLFTLGGSSMPNGTLKGRRGSGGAKVYGFNHDYSANWGAPPSGALGGVDGETRAAKKGGKGKKGEQKSKMCVIQ